MKLGRFSGRFGAFMLIELLCVIGIIGVLILLVLPEISKAQARAKQVECVSQLRQAGVAFHAFAHDHNGHFPMRLPVGAGGTAESVMGAPVVAGNFAGSYRHFQALSNDLVTPKLLVCPADDRMPAITFGVLKNENVSYFAALNADYSQPGSILAGDRNLTNDWASTSGAIVRLGDNFALRWTYELHRFKGNLLFSDGHVEERNHAMLLASASQVPAIAVLSLPVTAPAAPAFPTRSGAPVPTRLVSPAASPGTRVDAGQDLNRRDNRREGKTEIEQSRQMGAQNFSGKEATAANSQSSNSQASKLPTSVSPALQQGTGTVSTPEAGPALAVSGPAASRLLENRVGLAVCALLLILLLSAIALRAWKGQKNSGASQVYDDTE